ncbi:hypothetical protein pipiens_007924 [Culex pipiens pipiens]|uniref:Uncharacterized protein n=1 Tax=Culex pipiens pipiens TaxID=38569 RepID=A0ABD1DJD4_CULPP
MARPAKIQIDSNKRFPSCGSVGSYDFILEHTLGTCPGKEQTASPDAVHLVPLTFPRHISSTYAFEPLATPSAPKLLQVTGSKMSAAVAVPARS